MEKITLAYGPNLAVAEKPGQAEGSEPLLNHFSVVIGLSEHVLAAPVATAKAAAVDWFAT